MGHHLRENESGKGGTTTCGSMLCFPDTLLKSIRERLSVVSPSLMVLLPRTLLEHKKPQGHREDVLCTVSGLRSALNLTCVTTLSLLLGFEVAQALPCVFLLCSHMPHTGKELHRSGFPMQGEPATPQ